MSNDRKAAEGDEAGCQKYFYHRGEGRLGGKHLNPGCHFKKSGEKGLNHGRQKGKPPDEGGGGGKDKNVTGYVDNNRKRVMDDQIQ